MNNIKGFLAPVAILDEKIPKDFFDGVEEAYETTFREYAQYAFLTDEEGNVNDKIILIDLAKKIGNNGYSDATNKRAWLNYFSEEVTVYE
jgi:hypothetical protein